MASSLIRIFVLLLPLALAAPAAADQIISPIVPRISTGELQNLRSQQQRLDFQQQQQFNREIDNLSNQRQQQRLQVPVVKPRCPLQTSRYPPDLLMNEKRRG